MSQETLLRSLFGTLGASVGATIAWILTWALYEALFPKGLSMGWSVTPMPWQHKVLVSMCVISGALVGLALTQLRYLPADDESRKD